MRQTESTPSSGLPVWEMVEVRVGRGRKKADLKLITNCTGSDYRSIEVGAMKQSAGHPACERDPAWGGQEGLSWRNDMWVQPWETGGRLIRRRLRAWEEVGPEGVCRSEGVACLRTQRYTWRAGTVGP